MSMKNQKNVVNDHKNLDVNYLHEERKKERKKDRKRTIL
jgi:hypothetical protein